MEERRRLEIEQEEVRKNVKPNYIAPCIYVFIIIILYLCVSDLVSDYERKGKEISYPNTSLLERTQVHEGHI